MGLVSRAQAVCVFKSTASDGRFQPLELFLHSSDNDKI